MTTLLEEMRIVQLSSYNEQTLAKPMDGFVTDNCLKIARLKYDSQIWKDFSHFFCKATLKKSPRNI